MEKQLVPGEKFQSVLRKPDPFVPGTKGRTRIIQCFVDADLRLMLPGLIRVCEDHKISVEKLPRGSLIPFINSKRNFIKVLACNETFAPVLGCYRLPHGRIYDLRIIGEIPSAFRSDNVIDFDEALKLSIEKYYARTHRDRVDTAIINRAKV